jgi:hypothetical protein
MRQLQGEEHQKGGYRESLAKIAEPRLTVEEGAKNKMSNAIQRPEAQKSTKKLPQSY